MLKLRFVRYTILLIKRSITLAAKKPKNIKSQSICTCMFNLKTGEPS